MDKRDPEGESTEAKVIQEGEREHIDAATDPEVSAIAGGIGGAVTGLTIGAYGGPVTAVGGVVLGAAAGMLATGAAKKIIEHRDRDEHSNLAPEGEHSHDDNDREVTHAPSPGEGLPSVVDRNERRPKTPTDSPEHPEKQPALRKDQDTERRHPYEPEPLTQNPAQEGE